MKSEAGQELLRMDKPKGFNQMNSHGMPLYAPSLRS